jgi:hypothetical protein
MSEPTDLNSLDVPSATVKTIGRNATDPNSLDAPSATLYRAAISLGAQETQLIWTRYTGFIVMNGFFVSALANDKVREQDTVLAILGVVILVLNSVWHILNFAGWKNQNLLYHLASKLFTSEIGLLTDYFREKKRNPAGWIYWLAQTIPTMFSLIAPTCLAISTNALFSMRSGWAWLISFTLWAVAAAVVLWIEYKAIASEVKKGLIEPA